MIRPALWEDIDAMVRMARDFNAVADVGITFDPDYVASAFRSIILPGDKLALILEIEGEPHGMLCAAVSRSLCEPVAHASELIFWIDPDHRGRYALKMLDAYTKWAEASGCARVSMVGFGRDMDRLYARAGFAPAETTYSKAL